MFHNVSGRGRFTEVYEGEWDRKRGDVQRAAIKMLATDAPPAALQVSGVTWHFERSPVNCSACTVRTPTTRTYVRVIQDGGCYSS
jgi:hypothetical protein